MLTQNLVIFLIVTLAGFFIVFLGVRSKQSYRRYIITAGVAVLHVGIFGILYDKLSLTPFLALVFLVLSLFILIDPLKIAKNFPPRSFRTLGLFLLIAALAFAVMFITGFPVWLWILPFVIYVLPYLVPSWRGRHRLFQILAWFVIFLYVSIISYHIYTLYHPETKISFLENALSPLSNKKELQSKFKFLNNSSVTKVDIDQMLDDTQNNTDLQNLSSQPQNASQITEDSFENYTQIPQQETHTSSETHQKIEQTYQNLLQENSSEASTQTLTTQESTPNPSTELKTLPAKTLENEISEIDGMQGPLIQAVKEFDQKYLELKMHYRKLQDKYREALREIETLKKQNEDNLTK